MLGAGAAPLGALQEAERTAIDVSGRIGSPSNPPPMGQGSGEGLLGQVLGCGRIGSGQTQGPRHQPVVPLVAGHEVPGDEDSFTDPVAISVG